MSRINSYVFFDIETTGLPYQEKNRTKITELSFVATSRQDIINSNCGDLPPVSKVTLVFNPTRTINPEVVRMNGLSNNLLKHAPIFKKKIPTILTFLQDLPKPVCLIAHNGDMFDFKILLAEFIDANSTLPSDLLCLDSLKVFKNILNKPAKIDVNKNISISKEINESITDIMTDDEDDWPNLNLSTEEWKDIDEICDSLSDMSCEDVVDMNINEKEWEEKQNKKKKSRSDGIRKVFQKNNKTKENGYSLQVLYKRLVNKEQCNAHRAEADCLMLLECVVAMKEQFIEWADKECKELMLIKPLVRY